MANWPHPRTQDQSHTLLGKEPFFGHRVVSLCPVSHLCTIPGSWNLSQPGPGLIIPTWQSGIACCPHHQAQGWLQARAFHMGHGWLLFSNSVQRWALQLQTASEWGNERPRVTRGADEAEREGTKNWLPNCRCRVWFKKKFSYISALLQNYHRKKLNLNYYLLRVVLLILAGNRGNKTN